jgi:membrane-associated phospholipid phosphatase
MAISGLLGAVLAMYLKFSSNFSVVIGLLALIWGLVAYARITLKAHTEFEIYTGSILGLLVVFCTTFWGVTI